MTSINFISLRVEALTEEVNAKLAIKKIHTKSFEKEFTHWLLILIIR